MYLLKRQKCKNSKCKGNKDGFIKLVNNEYCMKCYQARYYQANTKKKRKKNKNVHQLMDVWWIEKNV